MSLTSAILSSIHATDFTVTTRRVQTADGVRDVVTAKDANGASWVITGDDEYGAVVELECDLEE